MKIRLLTIMALSTFASFAQETKPKDSTRFYEHAAFSIIYQNQAFDNLNARLLKYYPKSIPQNTFGISFGGKSAFNQFLVQGDMSMAFGVNAERGRGFTNAFLVGINIDGGIFLTRPGAVRIYPFTGLALDVAGVSSKMRTDNINFDTVLSNPVVRENTRPINVTNFFVSWRGGLAIDFGNPKKANHPYSFGIKAGYKQSFNTGRWVLEGDNTFTNAPSDKLQQWFATIVFYGPTEAVKKHRRAHNPD
jgi:hypothetical protein